MKFAHSFKEALLEEGFPPRWVESAIPYSQLKKCIKKVEEELKSLGLDVDTLRDLIPSKSNDAFNPINDNAPVAFQYKFTDTPSTFRPRLTLYVQVEDGVAIDATLSPDTRKYLEQLVTRQERHVLEVSARCVEGSNDQQLEFESGFYSSSDPRLRKIEVPLTFDAEFFGLLKGDVSTLDTLQAEEEERLTNEIKTLGQEVAKIVTPARKTDMNRWREIFDIYLQAGVFFSTTELDRGSRSSTIALKQLQWFQNEVSQRNLLKKFKIPASHSAYERFMRVNVTLLHNLKFQEINQLAISKILKKFDKRTSLGAKYTFPKLFQSDGIMSQRMAKAVCAGVSDEIIKLVPQLDDYLCPVCFSISYRPVRLNCNHVFCIRCMVQMQRKKTKYCPLCREDVIMIADSSNLDQSLMDFLDKYFPKESRAKQLENEIASGVDQWGPAYTSAPKCIVM